MRKLTRREMLRLMGYSSAGLVLAGCKPGTPSPEATKAPPEATKAPPEATEAPPAPATVAPPAEKITITHIEAWFGVPQFQDVVDPVNEAISEMIQADGLNIEVRSMILDDHETKYPLLYASGADFQCAFDAPWHRMPSLRDQGALLPLNDLFEEYGQSIIEGVTPRIIEFNKHVDGNLYGLPIAFYYADPSGITIRQDKLEEYGLEPPDPAEGWAGWRPFLEAARDDPEIEIPLASRAYKGDCMADWNQWEQMRVHPAGNENAGFIIPDWRKGQKWMVYEDVPTFFQAVSLLHEFWKDGLVPKVPISSDTSVRPYEDYFLPGKAAALVSNGLGALSGAATKAIQAYVPGAKVWAYFTQPYGKNGTMRGIGSLKQWNFIVFNAQAPRDKQIACVQFWNWLYSGQEQRDVWFFGIEGKDWFREEPFRYRDPEGVDMSRLYRKEWYISGIHGKYRRLPVDAPDEWVDHLDYLSSEEYWDFTPYGKFELDTKPIETEMATVSAAYDEAAYGWRTGTLPPEESIPRFTKMMNDAGRMELMEKCQKQLDDWIAANKDYIESFS